ncbi:LPXTG cell wall anchor domain-containing protein [Enterococcus casseliflavus]|uniref:LPXTG cell wall anchor domain-containing protein n=1 Tax=Enterococcus casseliflavus TaxID=37734 RepID=UPI0037BBDDED
MKKLILFLLTLLTGLSFHTSVGHANETSVQNKAGITFTESSEEVPSSEEKDSVQPESNDNKDQTTDKGVLPKTGEEKKYILTLVGVTILFIFLVLTFKNSKQEKE